MARVSGAEVLQIIDSELSADAITPFITAANLMVSKIIGLSADEMKEIERWVAAHFLAIRDPRYAKEKTGETEVVFAIKIGDAGLTTTPYGQQALVLDTTGTLINLGKKQAHIMMM